MVKVPRVSFSIDAATVQPSRRMIKRWTLTMSRLPGGPGASCQFSSIVCLRAGATDDDVPQPLRVTTASAAAKHALGILRSSLEQRLRRAGVPSDLTGHRAT